MRVATIHGYEGWRISRPINRFVPSTLATERSSKRAAQPASVLTWSRPDPSHASIYIVGAGNQSTTRKTTAMRTTGLTSRRSSRRREEGSFPAEGGAATAAQTSHTRAAGSGLLSGFPRPSQHAHELGEAVKWGGVPLRVMLSRAAGASTAQRWPATVMARNTVDYAISLRQRRRVGKFRGPAVKATNMHGCKTARQESR
jgi:hypothetical protein